MVNWAQSPSGFNSTPEAQGEPHSRATWPGSIHTRRPSLQGKRTSRLMFLIPNLVTCSFPGRDFGRTYRSRKGSMSRPKSQRGMRTKTRHSASPALQPSFAPRSPAPSDTHPRPPQTSPKQAATLHSPGPTSRDLGIPRRGGPAGNAGRLSPFQVTVPQSPAQDLTPAASPPARELSSGCWAEKVQPSAAFSLGRLEQITRPLWFSLFVQPG